MHSLKIITTVFIVFMILVILWFCKGFNWKSDKTNIIGFGIMEIVYMLSLICMWL